MAENPGVIWHRRYGHLGVKGLDKLATRKQVDGFDYKRTNELNFCEPCAEGKHHRSKSPTVGGKRAKEILELVHSDVCGKLEVKSLSRYQYFETFIDDKSRYAWSEVFTKFLEWKAMVEKASGKVVKTLQSENGGEDTSKEFADCLKSQGIRHEYTIRKTSEQNGVAERMNRILVEMVRSMLSDSSLVKTFWAEALSTAAYIRNRSPIAAVEEMTPYEAKHGERPNVQYFKVFGCDANVHVQKDERGKLDSKAQKCIFLGWGTTTKGYRLYDDKNCKILYSRDVLFNELKPAKETNENANASSKQDQKVIVELECMDE